MAGEIVFGALDTSFHAAVATPVVSKQCPLGLLVMYQEVTGVA